MNLDKLDAAIAYIEAHPEEWNQARWFSRGDGGCGTACCLAGTLAVLDGWTPTGWEPLGDPWPIRRRSATTSQAEKDGVISFADDIAMNVLGAERTGHNEPFSADERWCNDLFEADNTLDDIKRMRDELAATSGEAGERSDLPNPSDLGGNQ